MASSTIIFFVIFLILQSHIGIESRPHDHSHKDRPMHKKFEEWTARYHKVYATEEEKAYRFQVFKSNAEYVESFNRAGNNSFVVGLNQFSHFTENEFKKSFAAGNLIPPNLTEVPPKPWLKAHNPAFIPRSIDWRKRGAVTYVRDQGSCGGCWAFVSAATVEGIYKIRTGKLLPLSEQQLLDCVNAAQGCGGGYGKQAFRYARNHGITARINYPYKEAQGFCRHHAVRLHPRIYINDYGYVTPNDELSLRLAVSRQPIYVSINGGCQAFQSYTSGIYDADCGPFTNHAIALVGYGTDASGIKYWIAKNSWGTTWGENGYIRILRDVPAPQGMNGLATRPIYPII